MKPSTVNNAASIFVLLVIGIVLLQVTTTYAAPHPARYYPGYYSPMQMEGANSEYLLQTIARLRQALNADDLENENLILKNEFSNIKEVAKRYDGCESKKRGIDFGINRGFPPLWKKCMLTKMNALKTYG
ncbi:uncharacterized protein LOC109601678 isoform X1 [Aethina tumida]|uniref:uncharacterized protein LOC109601678 isoform X1 n=1 Tax=Aethina tumida TaxID=116153 RepID=UPI002148CE67|nr:uncharacterized protein LOC109601678 isoform X1 [Aethina tumida]